MRNLFSLVLLLFSMRSTGRAQLQTHTMTFHFERPGLRVPRFNLEISEAGRGLYTGDELPVSVGHPDTPPSPHPFNLQVLRVSHATLEKVFALTRSLNYFNVSCASTAKNVADTGKKTLTYSSSDGVIGSCDYNYTENKDVQTLTDILQGIAETMDEGRRLDYLHRYDRLGLDAELESFSREVADGRAIELQAIAETLSSIADDADVMQRVRTRAGALLTLVPAQGLQGPQ
jgi:hypothetical protein